MVGASQGRTAYCSGSETQPQSAADTHPVGRRRLPEKHRRPLHTLSARPDLHRSSTSSSFGRAMNTAWDAATAGSSWQQTSVGLRLPAA